MAFIGQETVRKQQRHNFLWRMYTLIAVFVHFNHFIDLKINFHTNPYKKLASSRLLWFWAPCHCTWAKTWHKLKFITHKYNFGEFLSRYLVKNTSKKYALLIIFFVEYYGFLETGIYFFWQGILFPCQWGITSYGTVNNSREMIF